MNKFHSTVSRRDFMKGIGLILGGAGATAATVPVFHDLDEMLATSDGVAEKRAWWIKEREYLNPVSEIDWNVMQRHGTSPATSYNNETVHLTTEEYQKRFAARLVTRKNYINGNAPGNTLRDYALRVACWSPVMGSRTQPYIGSDQVFLGQWANMLFGDLMHFQVSAGFPKWQGTPEDNNLMIRCAARVLGGTTVAFGELIPEKTQKLSYKWRQTYEAFEFEDVDKPYCGPVGQGLIPFKSVTPNKYKNVILCNLNEDIPLGRSSPSALMEAAVAKAYDQARILDYRMIAFIKAIGWGAVGSDISGMVMRPGWGEIAGLGECGRHHQLITPEYGPHIRHCQELFTDLPLTPTNPIEFGASRFCAGSCRKCSDICPGMAIPSGDRTWEITPASSTECNPSHLVPEVFNQPGKKIWYLNHFACHDTWVTLDNGCNQCTATCVFTRERLASIHEFVKPIVSTTPLLNGFFYNMDKAFGYGILPEDKWEDFWKKPRAIIGNNY